MQKISNRTKETYHLQGCSINMPYRWISSYFAPKHSINQPRKKTEDTPNISPVFLHACLYIRNIRAFLKAFYPTPIFIFILSNEMLHFKIICSILPYKLTFSFKYIKLLNYFCAICTIIFCISGGKILMISLCQFYPAKF